MYNSPELDGKYLGRISSDFVKVASFIRGASYAMRRQGISKYPIFPISKAKLPIGAPLLEEKEGLEWNYYISFLDEFVQRKIVEDEQLNRFVEIYKDPEEYCCLFVIDEDYINYTFICYPEEGHFSL